ncbi:zf-UBP-domain-containing protein [Dorcoceras hygrometricum]|uniref:Zf-UBP-domain-containing protein n=1 Tax=Dorcoceras hygrometricum TaxID=472368 RepID=A0A2Z7BMT2_9LAMI|nr:zf-UBP-domain-containing protein [Dorcoceras hygrometricum]
MERRRLTINSVSAVDLNSRCNQLLQAFSSKLQNIKSQATVYPVASYRLSIRKLQYIQSQATGKPADSYSDPVESTSRPTTGIPAASTDFQMVSLPPAGQPDASTSYPPVLIQRLDNQSQAPLPSYCNEGEPAVARSVVMNKRQQLSEQLLNNLLEQIQLLGCNQRSRWKESMAEIESCKCLKSRGQDLYYSGK